MIWWGMFQKDQRVPQHWNMVSLERGCRLIVAHSYRPLHWQENWRRECVEPSNTRDTAYRRKTFIAITMYNHCFQLRRQQKMTAKFKRNPWMYSLAAAKVRFHFTMEMTKSTEHPQNEERSQNSVKYGNVIFSGSYESWGNTGSEGHTFKCSSQQTTVPSHRIPWQTIPSFTKPTDHQDSPSEASSVSLNDGTLQPSQTGLWKKYSRKKKRQGVSGKHAW